jgi:hypothetical protein
LGSTNLVQDEQKDSAGGRFHSGRTVGRKREGASTVSFNHPLAVNSEKQEKNA